jgi:hypothetical protein
MLRAAFVIENATVAYSSVASSVLLSGNHFWHINLLLWQGTSYKTYAQWTFVACLPKQLSRMHVM